MYTLAYLDSDRSDYIEITICRNDEELIGILSDITGLEDLEEVDDIESATSVLEEAMANDIYMGALSITVVDRYGNEVFKM